MIQRRVKLKLFLQTQLIKGLEHSYLQQQQMNLSNPNQLHKKQIKTINSECQKKYCNAHQTPFSIHILGETRERREMSMHRHGQMQILTHYLPTMKYTKKQRKSKKLIAKTMKYRHTNTFTHWYLTVIGACSKFYTDT